VTAEQAGVIDSLDVAATSAVLIDPLTNQILYEKNAYEKRPMASTTKMMTGIITLERAELNEEVTISSEAAAVGESELHLQTGEKMTVRNLIYGLLVESANDAAVALANHVGGSVEGFVDIMNRKAQNIGAKDTHFANPHGLFNSNHYSTAYDLALIAKYCLEDETFSKVVGTKEYTITRPQKNLTSKIENHNKLLWQYPYANGVKTGYVRQAGYCLVSSANKNGIELIAVVLNSSSSDTCCNDSKKLLEYGFNEFKREKIIEKGKVYKKIELPEILDKDLKIVAAADLMLQVRKNPYDVRKVITSKDKIEPPINKGQKLGKIEVIQSGRSLGKVDLIAEESVPKPGKVELAFLWLKYIFKKIVGYF